MIHIIETTYVLKMSEDELKTIIYALQQTHDKTDYKTYKDKCHTLLEALASFVPEY